MFLAGESGRYRWKMYKQREKQPADKRRSQAAAAVLLSTQEQSAAPAMERWVLGGLGGGGADLITAPNYHQKKRERK